MEILVSRYSSGKDDTLSKIYVDGKFICYGIEDEYREKKVHSETRIPSGRYRIGLRTVGGFHNRYSKRFPSFHKGMLHILNVPDFEYILIHIGNTDKDSAGCLIVGSSVGILNGRRAVLGSKNAYMKLYKLVIQVIELGEDVFITFHED